ncbi:MAG: transketolase [Candidatus Komeilibacteria bacterium RIFOXYC1_FULL_37_11]|uniref:Transketolase n=1 Tax=Candidatus Komeilibacteria bacterium RIFOXYC1_FULL_37_11 TaxID=1798555 RepID=A0A1G2BZR5_9BACT|nr:MAG: transketolase [Candidatus Komeilibacteria bacterium RIFOXYC1_FULL_37_11]OGY95969.1 MAG: transketolase [Candidatus Komeilibacteria bacterium RIFOXYD1_FULL_37_29]
MVSNIKQQKNNWRSTRDGFGEAMLELGKKNKEVVVVSADLAESTRVQPFAKKYHERFIEVGVAEQNMLGVATGLALEGKIPFATSFGVFSPGRNWDQLRVSICYSRANVKIIASHTGLSVGPDGASHQALEDIAITRCLPNLVVLAPADFNETKMATLAAAKHQGPVYLRFARQASPIFTVTKQTFIIGRAKILIPGKDITIIGIGPLLYEAILAARELAKKGIRAEIINSSSIKPLDAKTILASVKKTGRAITLEDHQIHGGLGSAVAELLSQSLPRPLKIMGVSDQFGQSGQAEELWEKHQLTHPYIIQHALKLLKK